MTPLLVLLSQAAPAAPSAAATGSNAMLLWAVVLLGLAAALFVVEVFVPSGGVIGIVSAVCLVAGVVCMFGVDTTAGLITTIVALMAIPPAILGAMKVFPNTPIGQWLTLGNEDASPDPAAIDTGSPPSLAVGDEGTAINDLRPVGHCRIRGQRIECIAVGPAIEPGQKVRVVSAEGFETRVRGLD
jgi:membrane-bound serine protease (ClpP class)